MVVVGLMGKARAGKDSTVEIARRLLAPREVIRISFADGVREEGRASRAWDGVIPYTVEGRAALQRIGMARRSQNVDYWVNRALAKIPYDALYGSTRESPVVFFTDVRFRNEFDALSRLGAKMIRIRRTNPDGSVFDNGLTLEQKHHPSETELDSVTTVELITAVDMASLERAVTRMLRYHCLL